MFVGLGQVMAELFVVGTEGENDSISVAKDMITALKAFQ